MVVDTTPLLNSVNTQSQQTESLKVNEGAIESLWSLESIGIKKENYMTTESRTVDKVTSSLQHTPDGYSVNFPFKTEERPSSNYRVAYAQLSSIVQRFQNDVTLY